MKKIMILIISLSFIPGITIAKNNEINTNTISISSNHSVAERAKTEVFEFYQFYTGWLNGNLIKNMKNYRIKDIIADDLYFTLPNGQVLNAEMTIGGFYEAHQSIPNLVRAYAEDVKVQYSNNEIALISYTEVRDLKDGPQVKLRVLCMFRYDSSAPNKVKWSKMQDTLVSAE